ncbi:hypothetical protein NLK61_03795 [Pseudomonas fuscovaginae UPB0736]|uniref:Lipoprotein n=1 Tax=Pseudomonas asplenii TaxID=53407 RepID=A0A1H6NWR1_9PSED|nr:MULTISPECIES: hypothetical protein [Pseudomonas]UUQ65782.1 hypothetical protein NLK61_03795 [Pseudomonas fuscovaginae UPB0736]UZE30990.1 hypothetical protein LOY63_09760 [Pseudomonas asplenii]SDT37951.1 hypothetical protein SAMN05216598_5361 [Pseudomonas asplenii]SEI16281.1 hypothetical protein SAMN05216581_3128 [Pseudomonas fuscovaginae]
MKHAPAVLLLLLLSVLAGCASHPAPELRPYTAEETRELALEALNRRGLSFDEYQRKKAELMGQPQPGYGFDEQGEVSADRGGSRRSNQG